MRFPVMRFRRLAPPTLQRRHVTYSGHVQGVGFRYTARSIARGYDVTGYVRNLPDGRVELVAAGSSDELDHFLGELAEQMSANIRSVDCDRRTPIYESGDESGDRSRWGQFAEFAIRY